MRKIYLDPSLLGVVGGAETTQPDPRVVLAVRRAIKRLPDRQRAIIEDRFGECLTFEQIGNRLGLTTRAVGIEYYAAVRALREQLAPFVEKRWRIRAKGLCRICRHPNRGKIEEMLLVKGKLETWGAFGRRLERAPAEDIDQPPGSHGGREWQSLAGKLTRIICSFG